MVRCIDCGYLAARNTDTRQLEEVERICGDTVHEVYIQSDWMERQSSEFRRKYDSPICFARQIDLWLEYKRASPAVTGGTALSDLRIVTVLRQKRGCTAFTDYQQGFTSKEHREMMDRKAMHKWHMIELAILLLGNLAAAAYRGCYCFLG